MIVTSVVATAATVFSIIWWIIKRETGASWTLPKQKKRRKWWLWCFMLVNGNLPSGSVFSGSTRAALLRITPSSIVSVSTRWPIARAASPVVATTHIAVSWVSTLSGVFATSSLRWAMLVSSSITRATHWGWVSAGALAAGISFVGLTRAPSMMTLLSWRWLGVFGWSLVLVFIAASGKVFRIWRVLGLIILNFFLLDWGSNYLLSCCSSSGWCSRWHDCHGAGHDRVAWLFLRWWRHNYDVLLVGLRRRQLQLLLLRLRRRLEQLRWSLISNNILTRALQLLLCSDVVTACWLRCWRRCCRRGPFTSIGTCGRSSSYINLLLMSYR